MKSFPAALLAGMLATAALGAPPPAGPPKDRPAAPRDAIQRESAMDRDAANEPAGVPPMFKEMFPHRAEALEKMSREKPEEYRMTCHHLYRMARELEDLKGRDQEEYNRRLEILKAEQDVDSLAEKYRATQGTEGDKIARELRPKLEKLFDLKEKSQRAHLGRMESHLKEMRDKLDKRHKSRNQIIDKRLGDLKADTDLEF
jgi:hypothetical protein